MTGDAAFSRRPMHTDELTVPIVARLVRLSRLPLLRPLGRQVVDVVRLLRS